MVSQHDPPERLTTERERERERENPFDKDPPAWEAQGGKEGKKMVSFGFMRGKENCPPCFQMPAVRGRRRAATALAAALVVAVGLIAARGARAFECYGPGYVHFVGGDMDGVVWSCPHNICVVEAVGGGYGGVVCW